MYDGWRDLDGRNLDGVPDRVLASCEAHECARDDYKPKRRFWTLPDHGCQLNGARLQASQGIESTGHAKIGMGTHTWKSTAMIVSREARRESTLL